MNCALLVNPSISVTKAATLRNSLSKCATKLRDDVPHWPDTLRQVCFGNTHMLLRGTGDAVPTSSLESFKYLKLSGRTLAHLRTQKWQVGTHERTWNF